MKSIVSLLSATGAIALLSSCSNAPPASDTKPMVGTDLLKGHPRAERIIQKLGGAEAYNLIQAATQVEAVRIGRIRDDLRVDDAKVDDYPVIAKGEEADSELRARLKRALVSPTGALKTCLPRYGVRYRFTNGESAVDILVCYECNLFGVFRNGELVGRGEFDAERPEFVAIAKQLFPKDELIQAMLPEGCGPSANPSPDTSNKKSPK